jgi:signal peptide peptidase SppA
VGGVAVVSIAGPMTKYPTSFSALFGGTATVRTRQALRAAAQDAEVKGALVVVDSPGGTVAGTSDLADDVRRFASLKPVHVFVEDQAASAALWVISGAGKVLANASAEVGSIGTYMVVEDRSGAYTQAGVKVHVVSSAPPHKGAGVPGSEITAEQLAEWRRRVDDLNAMFVAAIAAGRRMPIERAKALATGQLWIASKAVGFGLIDGIASFDDALEGLRQEAMTGRPSGVRRGQGSSAPPRRATAYELVQELASGLVSAGRVKTLREGIQVAWAENPDLYRRHMDER